MQSQVMQRKILSVYGFMEFITCIIEVTIIFRVGFKIEGTNHHNQVIARLL
jgi:hypothetical protein